MSDNPPRNININIGNVSNNNPSTTVAASQESLTPRPPSRGRYSPAIASTVPNIQTKLSPTVSRSPSLHPTMVASPPHSPRISGHAPNHNRAPSFSSPVNMVELLAASSGTRPDAREWKTIRLGELVRGQKLHFIDGDTPVEEACQVFPPFRIGIDCRCLLIRN